LWIVHCQAVYDGVPASCPAISARFRFLLHRHFQTLRSSRFVRRIGSSPSLPPFF
jgi:hypothetical protein